MQTQRFQTERVLVLPAHLIFFILSGQKVGFSEGKLSNVSVITLVFILSG